MFLTTKKAAILFELPNGCELELKKQIKNGESHEFGRRHGLKQRYAKKPLPIRKPWRVISWNFDLGKPLSKKRNGNHSHGPCAGTADGSNPCSRQRASRKPARPQQDTRRRETVPGQRWGLAQKPAQSEARPRRPLQPASSKDVSGPPRKKSRRSSAPADPGVVADVSERSDRSGKDEQVGPAESDLHHLGKHSGTAAGKACARCAQYTFGCRCINASRSKVPSGRSAPATSTTACLRL